MKRNYDREFSAIAGGLGGVRPRVLMHICCGPCGSAVLERVCPGFDVTLFYFNPNTHPEAEYIKRGREVEKLLRLSGREDTELIWGDYAPERFFDAAKGLEAEPEGGARCERCFDLRLRETARLARDRGFDWFCSTLTVSPHKDAELINSIGERLAAEYGVRWLPSDFKKRDGYLRSIRLSAQYGLYRQCWCGCAFSMSPAAEH